VKVATARAIQWACLIIGVLTLGGALLARGGRVAGELIFVLALAVVVAILVGISAKAEGVVHLSRSKTERR